MTSTHALVITRSVPSQQQIADDIEHVAVKDDPRRWSKTRKVFILLTIFGASMIAGLNSNLYNPAIPQIKSQLNASSAQISLSLSLYILISGCFGVAWSAIGEVYGRKVVYLCSFGISIAGNIVAATAKSIHVLIGIRCLQAVGSSAVISIGAATLADIYDSHERGTYMGLYLCAPLLGPALGPIIGGILTQAFDWRATFWFLVIFTGLCFIAFLFFRDTFRRERSSAYQAASRLTQERAVAHARRSSRFSTLSQMTVVEPVLDISREKAELPAHADGAREFSLDISRTIPDQANGTDIEKQADAHPTTMEVLKHTLHNLNPIRPIMTVLLRMNNLAVSISSGLCFAFGYSITYTSTRTLSMEYNYNALQVGLVLLAFGTGSTFGSVLGGRWSDHVVAKFKAENENQHCPDIKYILCLLPASVVGYGWVCDRHVHVAAICVTLFFSGFLSMWMYSSTLTYIVDANVGRSSTAVATNSCFRGILAFVAAEVAVPLQDSIQDGGLYSMWAGLLLLAAALALLVRYKGTRWRDQAERRESSY